VLEQGPVLRALGRAALDSLSPKKRRGVAVAPGPWIEAVLPARSAALVADYARHVGAAPEAYAGSVPPHLFPQWAFPLAGRTLAGLPYPLARAVNAGCRLTVRAPLLAGETLRVRAQLAAVDDDGRRVRLTQRIVSGTRKEPEAVVAELRAQIPLARRAGPAKAAPVVPNDAEVIARLSLDAWAGLDFAVLTGDFNPIHWVPLWARAAGFRAPILHGFATLARAWEALAQHGGAPRELDARFVRPLALPAEVVVATREDCIWVGDRPGGVAYLEGRFQR
jgi:acyl dehydratase